jgi:hypothetical protein
MKKLINEVIEVNVGRHFLSCGILPHYLLYLTIAIAKGIRLPLWRFVPVSKEIAADLFYF